MDLPVLALSIGMIGMRSHCPSPAPTPGGLPCSPVALVSLTLPALSCRVVLSVNDKWHYCQNSDILVGSRAMRDRHLQLLGYCLIQVSGV